jgi:gliding motility-associated-like protein
MTKVKSFLFCCLVTFSLWKPMYAQGSNCENLGFEMGNFTNWIGYTWIYSTLDPLHNTPKIPGIVNRRQTIISDTLAYDSKTGDELKKIPPGYKYSARLGDEINNLDKGTRCWQQSLRYTLNIDSGNALLIMKFALVLEYADDHTASSEPHFRFTLFDQKGDTIPDCSNYEVYSSIDNMKGFKSNGSVNWRDWTTVGANLSKYIGQTITIEFMTADCTLAYHYGYAYFVAACQPLTIAVNGCIGDTITKLTAPEGFKSYRWMNSSGTVIDTKQIHKVENMSGDSTFSCTMVSATGCTVTLQLAKVIFGPNWEFFATGDTILCGTESSVLAASGAAHYIWNTSETSSSITVETSGIYTVKGTNNWGCEKSKTFNVMGYPLPLVDFTTSGSVLDKRHNQITCNIPAQPDVQYVWNLGDGVIETGSTIQHTYNISNSKLEYTISLKAISRNSCVDSAYKIIDVVPFVPNVFSPNGDGINDLFMSGVEIRVYDRNGLLLYEGTYGWDGTYDSRRVDNDTYFFMCTYGNQHKQTKKGYITLVR